MPESLGEKQRRFARMVGDLIRYAYSQGYELTLGDAYRDPRVHGIPGEKLANSYSSAYSVHKLRLAIDLNLFRGGKYLTSDEDHAILHDHWDSIGGGKRIPGDANHYSLEWEGRR
jgi:hypothetical protein